MQNFFRYVVGYILVLFLIFQVETKVPLIFPPASLEWACGIGIPLDNLKYESVVAGYELKTSYTLPDNVKQLRTKTRTPFESRKLGNYAKHENSLATQEEEVVPQNFKQIILGSGKKVFNINYRWTVYKGLEGLANRMGLSGRVCVLKSICETAETPFHYSNGLFAELLYILLTPSSSSDKLSSHADNEYIHAEHLGRSGANCHRIFKDCPQSLLDYFSDTHQLIQGVIKIMA